MLDEARSPDEMWMAPTHAPRPPLPVAGINASGSARAARPMAHEDALYGTVRVSAWAAALLSTPPFQRLAGVSLSDVPGALLFGGPFPSRLEHSLGVYHVTRLARPRDRALQVAALAHDLGHGPFSHLSEPLMVERLGEDHEARSARLLGDVRAALAPALAQQVAWVNWDEVARLMVGDGEDGRGTLLHGLLDYDNIDNVARFLKAARLGTPGYDPLALARGLRARGVNGSRGAAEAARVDGRVYVLEEVAEAARAWQHDRARVYRFLHEGHGNLAAHAMLRKAVDLAAATHVLPRTFFDMTDAQALRLLMASEDDGLARLAERVCGRRGGLYRCIWEAETPAYGEAIPGRAAGSRERLELEARLAAEAGLSHYDVILDALVSKAERRLPPIGSAPRNGGAASEPIVLTTRAPRVLHVFVAAEAAPDYVRRLRMAAERAFLPLGAKARTGVDGE